MLKNESHDTKTKPSPVVDAKTVDLSVVIPAYNEEMAIDQTVAQINAVLSGLPISYEVIIVDHGSTDRTA